MMQAQRLAQLRAQIRDQSSDMATYERREMVTVRLRRQRNALVQIARELANALEEKL